MMMISLHRQRTTKLSIRCGEAARVVESSDESEPRSARVGAEDDSGEENAAGTLLAARW